jgi:UDP-N-acetylmuramate--alanine ligase
MKQAAENIPNDIDVLVYSPSVPADNPERIQAEKLGITSYSYPEFLALLTQEYQTIAISGTNGKTTTTAMVATVFEHAGLDPNVIVGSIIPQWRSNARIGDSNLLIIEACEHQEHMNMYATHDAIITNIAADHLDYYPDLQHIQAAFKKFAENAPGICIMNADDENSSDLSTAEMLTFGIENQSADIRAENITIKNGKQVFDVIIDQKRYTNFELAYPGTYNVYNALAAIAIAHHYGISIDTIREGLSPFAGTWRRFELLGEYRGASVISDYAHHPDAVAGLIEATHDFYPDKQIIAVFQPHQHNRTKNLLAEFADSLLNADMIIMPEIFDVAGREESHDQDVSSADIIAQLQQKGKIAHFAPSHDATKLLIDQYIDSTSILLFIGAGDIYLLGEKLAKK